MGLGLDIMAEYFDWLCSYVDLDEETSPYYNLCEMLFDRDFDIVIDRDENRVADGYALRDEYLDSLPLVEDISMPEKPCSVFEVMIGLARRMAFEVDEDSHDEWSQETVSNLFFELLGNLGLLDLTDDDWDEYPSAHIVNDTLDILLDRSYDPDGGGGLFPLSKPPGDQRDVELWYQMQSYLGENYGV